MTSPLRQEITSLSDKLLGWRDISTAPKDGTWILLSQTYWVVPTVGFWADEDVGWSDGEYYNLKGFTHWMPLPPPPNKEPQP